MADPRWFEEVDGRPPKHRVPLGSPVIRAEPTETVKPEDRPRGDAPEKVASAYVRSTGLSDDQGLWVSKVNTLPHYVIVGQGFSAAVNFATLLRTPEGVNLLQNHPVIIIGFDDPWFRYRRHEMNQERELLSLPGFENLLPRQHLRSNHCPRLHDGFPERTMPFVVSNQFAIATATEWNALRELAKLKSVSVETMSADVDKIVRRDDDGLFIVHLQRGGKILARYVDLCVGPGQSRILPQGEDKYMVSLPASVREQYERPSGDWSRPYVPKVIAGSEYTRENVVTPPNSVVLVQGAGPAAGQGVEEAFRMGAEEVLWITSGTHHGAFIPNGRIDFLVHGRKADVDPWLPLTKEFHDTKPEDVARAFKICSRIEGLYLASCSAKRVVLTRDGKRLLVTFDKAVKATGVDGVETKEFSTGMFDQIVIAQGRENDFSKPGSPGFIIRELDVDKFVPIKVPTVQCKGKPFGLGMQLEDSKGRVRILGAAGLSSTGPGSPRSWLGSKGKDEYDALHDFEDSLPSQARVFHQGVTLSAVTIAYANAYFDGTSACPNTNRNTSTKAELDALEPNTADTTLDARSEMRALTTADPVGASHAMYDKHSEYQYRRC